MKIRKPKQSGRGREMPLTPMQVAFARHLFEGKTQTEAYVAAGYAAVRPAYDRHFAHSMAQLPKIKAEIERLQQAMIYRSTWDALKVFREYTELLGRAKDDVAGEDRPTVLRCLEMISKFIGMHVERKELTLRLGNPSDDPKMLDDQITQLARLVGREDIIPLIELDPSQVVDVTDEVGKKPEDIVVEVTNESNTN